MIYVAFYKHKKRVTSLKTLWYRLCDTVIRWVTRSAYSHCEIAIRRPDGRYDCYSASARDGGVRKKVMSLPHDRWDFIPVSISRGRVKRIFKRLAGSRYDYLGVIGFAFHKQQSDRYYCSEFCAEVLKCSDTQQSPQSLFQLLTKTKRIK